MSLIDCLQVEHIANPRNVSIALVTKASTFGWRVAAAWPLAVTVQQQLLPAVGVLIQASEWPPHHVS